jgi:hypothetical protein
VKQIIANADHCVEKTFSTYHTVNVIRVDSPRVPVHLTFSAPDFAWLFLVLRVIRVHHTALIERNADKLRYDYLFPNKSKIRDMIFVIVPIGKNHNPKIQTMVSAVRAHDKPNTKQVKTAKAASPYPTKIDFMNVERGSIPTALIKFDHGPN